MSHPDELATLAGWRLPRSLRQDVVYELSGRLVEKIWVLHKLIGESPTPVETLDKNFPDWRDELPLNLEDETARELLKSLLHEAAAVVRRGGRPLRLIRGLVRNGDQLKVGIRAEVPNSIPVRLLADLLDLPENGLPASMQLWFEDEVGNRELCAIATLLAGANEAYRLEGPFAGGSRALPSADPEIEWRISATSGVREVATQLLRGGAALQPVPWVFAEGEEGWHPLIGQGSVRTSRSEVLVAPPRDAEVASGDPCLVGDLNGGGRRLFRITGVAELARTTAQHGA